MWSKRRRLNYWVSAWLPVAVCIAVVAMSSSAWFGSNYTSGPLRWIWQGLFGPVSNKEWNVIHFYIRKSGHFTGYGLIGLAWLRAWWMTLPQSRFLHDAVLAVLGSAVMASCDEYHQTFLPNRTGSPRDVLLDCCGALTMQLLVYIFMHIFRPKRLSRRP